MNIDSSEDASADTGFNDFVGEIEDSMKEMIKNSNAGPNGIKEQWSAFSSAVNWSETWLQVLIGFHILMLLLVIIFRKNEIIQAVLFLIMAAIIYFSERINHYCAEHWKEFSTQNYFDEHGVFSGIFLAAPLLVILFIQLINMLKMTASTLITAKRLQLKQQMKQKKSNTDTVTSEGHGKSIDKKND